MAYRVNNKAESNSLITRLNLNRVPERFMKKEDFSKMKEFFAENKADLYVLRHAEKSSSRYEYVKTAEECYEKAQSFLGDVIVAVSINAYKNKCLLGAIELADDRVKICATENPDLDHRTMYGRAEFNLDTTIFDEELSRIPYFDFLYEYVVRNKLHGLTMEFTIYDCGVGIKNEKIIVTELRNY